METQIKKVGEDVKIVITIDANELAKLIGPMQTELFKIAEPEKKAENPYKYMQENTKKFVMNLVKTFGTDIWVFSTNKILNDFRWNHRVDNVGQIFKRFYDNGWMDVEYNENKTRIIRFKFKNNAQWI